VAGRARLEGNYLSVLLAVLDMVVEVALIRWAGRVGQLDKHVPGRRSGQLRARLPIPNRLASFRFRMSTSVMRKRLGARLAATVAGARVGRPRQRATPGAPSAYVAAQRWATLCAR
jgi:hypothetical protein